MFRDFIIALVFMWIGGALVYTWIKVKEPAEYFEAANKYQNFQYLIANIRSCSKFSELVTCANWLDAIKPTLELHAHQIALDEISKKEKELLDDLNRQEGQKLKRMQ